MDRSGRRARARCTACGAVWRVVDARFCGRCGARLVDRRPAQATVDDLLSGDARGVPGGTDRPAQRGMRRGIGAVVVMILVAAGVGVSLSNGVGGQERAGSDAGVELPKPGRVEQEGIDPSGDDQGDDLGTTATTDRAEQAPSVPSVAPVGCDPSPCLRWRHDLPQGEVTLLGELLVHAVPAPTQVDPATGERRPPEYELILTAIDAREGTVTWHRRLPWPGGDNPAPVDLVPVDVDLLLVASSGEVHAVDARGERLWSRPSPDGRTLAARATAAGDVLVWARGLTATGSHSESVRPDGAAVSAVSLLDRSSGEVRWGRAYARLLAWTADHVVLLEMVDGVGEIVTVDVAGTERWRRTRGTAEVSSIVGDGVVALADDAGVRLIDLASGDEVHRIEVEDRTGELVAVTGAQPTGGPVAGHGGLPLLVLVQADDRVELRAHDEDGSVRWRHSRPSARPGCCWQLGTPGADGRIALLPPPHPPSDVELVDPHDGRTVASIPMPSVANDEVRHWVGGLIAIDLPRRPGPRTTYQGTRAAVSVAGPAELVTVHPIPVLVTPEGLVGLQPEAFLDP